MLLFSLRMKATDLLKQQHREVLNLFKQISKAPRKDTKRRLFQELAANLVAHDGIEREIFYPECESALGMTDLLGESLVEHGVVEFSLFQAEQALGSEEFEYKLTVLKEVLSHHIEEEQDELFPKVERALGAERLNELGQQMKARFQEALKEDFRGPLYNNLNQVLKGAIKPSPKGGSKRPRARAA
jgi:hemerythrin-like domain-containing protein